MCACQQPRPLDDIKPVVLKLSALVQEVCLHPLVASWLDNVSLSSALRGLAPLQAVRLAEYLLKWLRALDREPLQSPHGPEFRTLSRPSQDCL